MNVDPKKHRAEYGPLPDRMANVGWISQRYVQHGGCGAGGIGWQWPRKVKGKTAGLARQIEVPFQWMPSMSRQPGFGTLPDTDVANGSRKKSRAVLN